MKAPVTVGYAGQTLSAGVWSPTTYEQIYQFRASVYGTPDEELMDAMEAVPGGRVLDVGGGQGRHALALAAMGFEVEVVDSAPTGLAQITERAGSLGLSISAVCSDITSYTPQPPLAGVVAALVLHLPSRWASRRAAGNFGRALEPGGLFYLSMPGYSPSTRDLACELLDAAGCEPVCLLKHLVTRMERPDLSVPRRNETRAMGVRPGV
jgi:SAM-dependent methyltransferase